MQIRRRLMADCTKNSVLSDDDDKRKIFCGNLSEKVTQTVLFELFLQAGPVESVEIPKSKDGQFRNYAFITYAHVSSVPYALRLFADVKLYNRRLVLRNRTLSNSKTNAKTTSKVTNNVEKDVNCVISERRETKRTRNRRKQSPRQDQPLPKPGKNDEFIRKLNNIKSRLPRMPLQVSNDCRVPKNTQANMNVKCYPEFIPPQRDTGPIIRTTIPAIENLNNLSPTINLTSQLLNNYIYLMQKVIQHWPQ